MPIRRTTRWLLVLTPLLPTCSEAPPSSLAPPAEVSASLSPSDARSTPRGPRITPASPLTTTPLSPALRIAAIEARQAEATAAHRVRATPEGLRADVREQRVSGTFDERGAVLRGSSSGAEGRLALVSLGRAGGARQVVQDVPPVASEHAVRWEHPVGDGSVQETWQAGPLGLEHRVLVRQRPEGHGAVELEVATDGLRAEARGERVLLRGEGGALAVSDYFVRDARGTLLAGTMSVRAGFVVYRYEDEGARYPVEIDPLVYVQQSTLLADDKADGDFFGGALALSGDGTLALVGTTYKLNEAGLKTGAVYAFERSGTTWTQQRIFANDKEQQKSFGASVALSADGSTALITDTSAVNVTENGTHYYGAAYVFARSGQAWTQQAVFLPEDKQHFNFYGGSTALSDDGTTALVSARSRTEDGALTYDLAYLYQRQGKLWTLQQKLITDDKSDSYYSVVPVSLSGDGTTALVSALNASDEGTLRNGATYVFVRSGTAWSKQAKLLASDKSAEAEFGSYTAITKDGSMALISAPGTSDGETNHNGSVYVFTREGSSWSQQQKLLADNKNNYGRFGGALAMSSDGLVALVSGHTPGSGPPSKTSIYQLERDGNTWSQVQKFSFESQNENNAFGYPVSLSRDASTALIGASSSSNGETKKNGSVLVFAVDPLGSNGEACLSDPECASGFCADGFCCDTACDAGPCDTCSQATGALTDGTCTPLPGDGCTGEPAGAGGVSGASGSSGHSGHDPGAGATGGNGAAVAGAPGKAGVGGYPGEGGSSGSSGHEVGLTPVALEDGGCGCHTPGRTVSPAVWSLAVLALGLGARRRREVASTRQNIKEAP